MTEPLSPPLFDPMQPSTRPKWRYPPRAFTASTELYVREFEKMNSLKHVQLSNKK